MSVHALNDPHRRIIIQDELESFFHVLIYYSVRYLESNCDMIETFIQGYFHNYAGPGLLHTCGWKSLTVELDDYLSIQFPHQPLLFDSPMDDLLDGILKCFRAHYKVVKEEYRKAMPPPRVPTPPPCPPSGENTQIYYIPKVEFFGDDANASDDDLDFDDYRPPDDTPTERDRELSRRIEDHSFTIDHITQMLHRSDWPEDDRRPQVKSQTPTAAPDIPLLQPNNRKRRRIAGPDGAHATHPLRFGTSTRRLRSRVRTAPIRAR